MIKKNEAIAISVAKDQTYAEVTKKIKEKMGNDVEGIKRIRHTRTGDILIEFNKDKDSTDFHDKVKKILGDETMVRRLVPKITIEISDIDPGAEKEEILESLELATGVNKENIRCKNIRSSYIGTQTAIIEGPSEISNLLREGKVKIGWVFCRIKQIPNVIRCFKCHNFGHVASRCAVAIGELAICRRCGDNSHTMSDCKAEKARCRLCAEKGKIGVQLNHIAGFIRCDQYKEAISGASKINKIQA